MKIQQLIKYAAATLAGLALACSAVHTQAGVLTSFSDAFPNNGHTGLYQAPSFTYWYSVYQDPPFSLGYNLLGTNDAAVDETGDTNDSGSMFVYAPFSSTADQNVFYITFNDDGQYDTSGTVQMIIITNISWDIRVATNSPTDGNGNFGTLSGGLIAVNGTSYDRYDMTYLTIPGSASNGWVHMSETNVANFISAANAQDPNEPNGSYAFGVCFDQNSYGGFPKSPMTFWIDNVTLQTATAPPPPPPPPTMSISPAVQGLNLFTGQSTSINDREDLETTQGNYSWVGASGPVTYSFTITNYNLGSQDEFQTQIFLIPNPGTESAPDYSEANCIFMDMESTTNGRAVATFRYKTNNPNGNQMIYGTNIFGMQGDLGTVTNLNGGVGTWSLTFNNNTNVTMSSPTQSTNFNIPDGQFVVPAGGQTNVPAGTIIPAGSTSALFASGVEVYFGVQGNNTAAIADHIVASGFSVSGLGSADFTDNFVTDAATNTYVNGAIWMTNAAYPACVTLIGPGNPYWVDWTTPAPGFSLESSPSLSNPVWTPAAANTPFLAGATETQLINTNDLPSGKDGFFALVQRTFTQLLVLLPGETNAPGTSTGKVGTPTPVSLEATAGQDNITVMAVDSHFFPVAGISDIIQVTSSTDPGKSLPSTGKAMAGGVALFDNSDPFYFGTAGTWTVTVTDTTSTNIATATSSQVTVTQ